MHPGVLAVVPQPLGLVHLYHPALAHRLVIPVIRIVAVHIQERPHLVDYGVQALLRYGIRDDDVAIVVPERQILVAQYRHRISFLFLKLAVRIVSGG